MSLTFSPLASVSVSPSTTSTVSVVSLCVLFSAGNCVQMSAIAKNIARVIILFFMVDLRDYGWLEW